MDKYRSQIKLSMFIHPDANDDELLFAKQLGVSCVYTWIEDHQRTYEFLANLRQKVERAGLTLYNAGNMGVAKSDKIHLALPGRDEKIAEFQEFIRNLGRAGIHTTTFTWEPTRVWSSEMGESRGAVARHVDLREMERRPFTHGRTQKRKSGTTFSTLSSACCPSRSTLTCGLRCTRAIRPRRNWAASLA